MKLQINFYMVMQTKVDLRNLIQISNIFIGQFLNNFWSLKICQNFFLKKLDFMIFLEISFRHQILLVNLMKKLLLLTGGLSGLFSKIISRIWAVNNDVIIF